VIPKETIDTIFETARIDEVVGDFVTLKKRGANLLGVCPFHDEKTPSFTVSPAKGIYKCFGCGKGGNSVNFVMDHEQFTYPEALRYLAKKYHIEIEEEEQTPEQLAQANARESLYVVSNYAHQFFQDQLATDEGKAIAMSYFKERGMSEETIKKFQLGYSPEAWDAFTKQALKAGHQKEYLEASGLSIFKENKQFDRFRGRVMFPIHSLSGRILGFGGRTLKNDKKAAKYVNSPESDIYHKSRVLYGLYFAKSSIVKEDLCYLVEGYTDVTSMHQAGVENVVASSGTALTPDQIKLIGRYTKNITILFDGDAAGIKASFRGIDLILEAGMNVKVVLFPDGEDPDSYAKKVSQEELKSFIEKEAQDFIKFKTQLLKDEVANDPSKRAALIKEIIQSISIIPDHITKAVYVKECSQLLDIDEGLLTQEVGKKSFVASTTSTNKKKPISKSLPAQQQSKRKNETAEHEEKDIIRFLLSYGSQAVTFVEHIKEETEDKKVKIKEEEYQMIVGAFIVDELAREVVFENEQYAAIFQEYVSQIEQDNVPSPQHFLHHPEQHICQAAVDAIANPYSLSENWEKHGIYIDTEEVHLRMAVETTVYSLKLKKVQQRILAVRKKMMAADEDTQIALLEEMNGYITIKKLVAEKLGRNAILK
jgi:DNA primase